MNNETIKENDYVVEVQFDGKTIPMVPFVQEVIRNVVIGLMKSLRGYEHGAEIRLLIK
ncbi:MAG TPA: hypothetical protein PLV37_01320 [Bacillota bacterium]|nr:hypothetical protein [Bacillota bacterium]